MYNIEQDDYKAFVIKRDGYPATAELSRVDNEFVRSYLQIDVTGTWYYFNRLVVNPKIRGKGIATQIMRQVVSWADGEKVNVLNEVNPYGDLNMGQLIRFYERFGFKQYSNNLMVRRLK